jgi:aspartokinase
MIATSPIKVSCMVQKSEVPRAVQALHAAFELEKDPTEDEAVRG